MKRTFKDKVAELGLELVCTGGNCEAYSYPKGAFGSDKRCVLVTDDGGSKAPTSERAAIMIGVLVRPGEESLLDMNAKMSDLFGGKIRLADLLALKGKSCTLRSLYEVTYETAGRICEALEKIIGTEIKKSGRRSAVTFVEVNLGVSQKKATKIVEELAG